MIYKFHLISDEVSNFKLELRIDADDTFLKLRNAILDAVGYSKDEMDSFILCDDDWQKEKEVTLADMGTDSDEDVWLMADTVISDLIEDEGQKMMFVFDYLTNRAFFMEMKELIPMENLIDPLCSRKIGIPPKQHIDLKAFDDQINKAAASTQTTKVEDLDEDFYGSDSYNEDEFDSEGFDALDME